MVGLFRRFGGEDAFGKRARVTINCGGGKCCVFLTCACSPLHADLHGVAKITSFSFLAFHGSPFILGCWVASCHLSTRHEEELWAGVQVAASPSAPLRALLPEEEVLQVCGAAPLPPSDSGANHNHCPRTDPPCCSSTTTTVDAAEVAKFSRIAEQWWDLDGPYALLHGMNKV